MSLRGEDEPPQKTWMSIFLFPLSAVIVAKIFYSYYSIRRYEKEHNIKFRSSFVLVGECFKEENAVA